ncbi:MAG: ATP-binding protein, partial [Candidatus Dormibacteria bacterium]
MTVILVLGCGRRHPLLRQIGTPELPDSIWRGAAVRAHPRGAATRPTMGAVTEWFAGRAGPLERLASALDDASQGMLRVVLVSGEAGMGKTSLVARAVLDARARGGTVAWGTCWDAPSAPAFWPWTQALRGVVAGVRSADLAGEERHRLARLLPELGRPDDPGSEAADEE